MLAAQLAKAVTLNTISKYWLKDHQYGVEPKVDGLRLIIVRGQPFSINGKPLYNLGPAIKEIQAIPQYMRYVFDGEADCGSWEETMQLIRASVTQKTMPIQFRYHLFDKVLIQYWEKKKETEDLEFRRVGLEQCIREKGYEYVAVMPHTIVNLKEIAYYFRFYEGEGYEGVVIKDRGSSYYYPKNRADRPKTWMKIPVKKSQDCKIIGFNEGYGKYEGALGSLIVTDEVGNVTKISGMDDEWRERFWQYQSRYMGKMVKVEYKKLTPKGVMYAGQFKGMREDKDE